LLLGNKREENDPELYNNYRNQSLAAYLKAIRDSLIKYETLPQAVIYRELRAISGLQKAGADLDSFECAKNLLLLVDAAIPKEKDPDYEKLGVLLAKNLRDRQDTSAIGGGDAISNVALKGPIVIIAGGCNPKISASLKAKYEQVIVEAFDGFSGTIISGGTQEGISGIAASVKKAYPEKAIGLLAYMPTKLPIDANKNDAYTHVIIENDTGTFSPLGPICVWADLIAAKVDPKDVKVIGLGGGFISAIEYRLALALGAKVAVIPGSDGAVDAILEDPEWADDENLIQLPVSLSDDCDKKSGVDPATFNELINYPVSPVANREQWAKRIHENYLNNRLEELKGDPSEFTPKPAMAPWDKLPENLKKTNLEQADHIQRKLDLIGCYPADLKDGETPRDFEFLKGDEAYKEKESDSWKARKIRALGEVEFLSEVEHGRWNVEKLMTGWRYAAKPKKDKNEHNCILPWVELTEKIKDYDREPVKKMPEELARAGIEIRRKKT
jgi:hypothetical protein